MPAHTAVADAITSRRSVRGFLPRDVDRELIVRILQIAASAPSGSNIQPWKVHVVQGALRDTLSRQLVAAHEQGLPSQREYEY